MENGSVGGGGLLIDIRLSVRPVFRSVVDLSDVGGGGMTVVFVGKLLGLGSVFLVDELELTAVEGPIVEVTSQFSAKRNKNDNYQKILYTNKELKFE